MPEKPLTARNRKEAEIRILQSVHVKCQKCGGDMIRVHDLRNNTIVGYSCQDCAHYYLFH